MLRKTRNRLKILSCYFAVHKRYASITEYIDFIFHGCNGLLKPLQVESEIHRILDIVKRQEPNNILEIGTANGGTLFLFSRASSSDSSIISVDLPAGNYGGGYSPIRIPLYKSFARGSQRITLIRGDSHEISTVDWVKSVFNDKQIDFLFIDGDHSYEGVKKDFLLYMPQVRKGGIIAFHDIAKHPKNHSCDVDRFWNEIKTSYEHEEIIENIDQGWAGIGVLYI